MTTPLGVAFAVLRWFAHLALNVVLIADMAANLLLLGRPGETISHRVARMRLYGGPGPHRVGCVLCAALSALFWFNRRDHCSYSLDEQIATGRELWRWSK